MEENIEWRVKKKGNKERERERIVSLCSRKVNLIEKRKMQVPDEKRGRITANNL